MNHNFVGTEHLLLGLIKLGSDMGADALLEMDVDLEKLRTEIEKSVGFGPDQRLSGSNYTPRSRRVLDLASKEATALKQTRIGTEHILLGLLAEGQGVAALVLKTSTSTSTSPAPPSKNSTLTSHPISIHPSFLWLIFRPPVLLP
jgi:ATP-dependent Clp protease ATP-binding subunit ClpC